MATEEIEKLPEYSKEDVKKHYNHDSCWVILNDEVYDLTTFLYEHPGGEEVLLERAGGDGTDCFDHIGHSSEAKERRKQYRIGVLREEDRSPSKDIKDSSIKATESEDIHSSGAKKKPKEDSYIFPAFVIVVAFLLWFYVF